MSQFILNVEPDEAEAVLRMMLASRPTFARSGGRVGWGWTFQADNGRSYFVAETKRGLSARPARSATPPACKPTPAGQFDESEGR